MSSKPIIKHITPAGGNVFADLGFPPEEAAALKAESDRVISKELALKNSAERMQAAPHLFTQKEWNALETYDGQVVSGDPEGRVPENLEADDNE
ncbi:MAG: hypothetical protein AB1540_15295 [Bdellovibrionota bacterium]